MGRFSDGSSALGVIYLCNCFYAPLTAFENIGKYAANFQLVGHVLMMNTIFLDA
ncbi:DUF2165 family protein [Yokenella regensburgei]|uniref:DUF2165 family protein n=1 Tax=Yokenella regensburgei TaxID=158877 RepID=UPI003ED8A70F